MSKFSGNVYMFLRDVKLKCPNTANVVMIRQVGPKAVLAMATLTVFNSTAKLRLARLLRDYPAEMEMGHLS